MTTVLMGSKALALRIARSHQFDALVTFDDSSDSRSVLERLKDLELPVHVAKHRQDSERILGELKPDICFVAGWYWILPPELLRRTTFVGIHNSLLPKYRGWAPAVWALINGERHSGVSMFKIQEGIDTGPVYGSLPVKIGPSDYIDTVLSKMEEAALSLLRLNFSYIISGQLEAKAQAGVPSYGARRTEQDGLIDWSWPARKVFDFIRAQSRPYPGAFFHEGERELIVWKASLAGVEYYGRPGTIVGIAGKKLVICGDSSTLSLDETEAKGDGQASRETQR